MPELPEVETVVRKITKKITGKTFSSIDILWARSITAKDLTVFKKNILSSEVINVVRRGKYIEIELQNPKLKTSFLITHLRMSGDLVFYDKDKKEQHKHLRVKFNFSDDSSLNFIDTRKFGRISLVEDKLKFYENLGLEPLSEELTPKYLLAVFKNKKSAIKKLLLDQTIIAGIGNIYASEALWLARINPLKIAAKLKEEELSRLVKSLKKILSKAIKSGGTDLGDGVWKEGDYEVLVYGEEGNFCKRCQIGVIKKIVIAQRSTYFCKECQK